MSRAAVLFGVALPLSFAVACRPPSESGAPYLSRLLDRDAGESFRLAELIESVPAPMAPMAPSAGCLAGPEGGWQVELPATEYRCLGDLLRLTPTRRLVTLHRTVDFDAADVDAFEVVVAGMPRQLVGVEWVPPGGSFDAKRRRVEASVRVEPEGGEGSCRLRVKGQPEWRGRIGGLRLTLVVPPSGAATVSSFSPRRERVEPERLAAAADHPWKLEIGNEMRGGWLGVPGRPLRWSVEPPAGAELWLALGVVGGCDGAVRFRVDAVEGGAGATPDGAVAGGEAIFSDEIPCDDLSAWRETRVPLGDHAGRPLTLAFSTAAAAANTEFDPTAGIPVWAGLDLVAGGRPPRRNLVLISVDTLRPDHLSLYGYPRRTTPNLDARAERGAVVFERAISAAPWTLPSHSSIFTGLDAVRHGVNQNRGLPPALITLADVLRGAGYATRAVTGGGFVHQQYGFADGFDVYTSFSERMGFADELDTGVARAKVDLDRLRGRNFFLFFHTYAVHNPFRPRQPYLERLTGRTAPGLVDVEIIQPVADDGFRAHRALVEMVGGKKVDAPESEVQALAVDLYDSGIAYADDRLADLLAAVDALGDDTLILFTSDHGELFGEHGVVNHISLYDENVRVPLVVFDPAAGKGVRRVKSQVRSIDILPTVLELLGLPSPQGIDGRSFAAHVRAGGDGGGGGPTGDAWSYSSVSNYGISLRRPDGTAYVARNDAWVAPGPREELLRPPASGAGGTPELRAATERELAESLAGLRIRCRNSEGVPLEVTLWGANVSPTRMKIAQIGPGVLVPGGEGPAHLTVPPGGDVTLVVEGRSVASVHARVTQAPAGSYQLNVDPAELDQTLWYGRVGGGWQVGHGEPPAGTAVSFRWQGSRDGEGSEGQEPVDEALQRQLKALGYVH